MSNKVSVNNKTEIFVSENGGDFASTTIGQFIVKHGLPCADEDDCLFWNDSDVALFKRMLDVQGEGLMQPGLTRPQPVARSIQVQLRATCLSSIVTPPDVGPEEIDLPF